MEGYEIFQYKILQTYSGSYPDKPLSEATRKAFLDTPRHLFIKRYRLWRVPEVWFDVNEENLEEHLATLYSDQPLALISDDEQRVPSTISQPSLVLYMLDMLSLEPGHKVFELGAGSGWNAALMGHLVGAEGHVYSLEIIPEMAQRARDAIESLGRKNVSIITADGGEGYEAAAPYDRVIFTAGTYDLPSHFYEQIKEDGLLLIVIKNEGGGDNLFLLRKTGNHFESLESLLCGFVPMTGKYQLHGLEPIDLESLPEWESLKDKEVSTSPFWWGGNGKSGFIWRTMGIRSYLNITEPLFKVFKSQNSDFSHPEERFFGLWDQEKQSLVITKDDQLVSYGSEEAKERLISNVKRWVDLGMPGAASFNLQIHPIDAPLTTAPNQWLVKRKQSQFLWSLDH